MSERLGRSVHYGFEANSGDFVVIYEWSLRWNKKMGKFFTSQEKGKIENCKKQVNTVIMKQSTERKCMYYFDIKIFHNVFCVDPRSRK